jgi:hypothetical protein
VPVVPGQPSSHVRIRVPEPESAKLPVELRTALQQLATVMAADPRIVLDEPEPLSIPSGRNVAVPLASIAVTDAAYQRLGPDTQRALAKAVAALKVHVSVTRGPAADWPFPTVCWVLLSWNDPRQTP